MHLCIVINLNKNLNQNTMPNSKYSETNQSQKILDITSSIYTFRSEEKKALPP